MRRSFFLIAAAAASATASAIPSNLTRRDGPLVWGSIGDSFCSGVAYSPDTAFDNNADGCERYWDAWSLQLSQDTSWTADPRYGSFKGCSGATLVDMHGYGQFGRQLINQVVGTPQIIFMQAGGNNAKFGEIIANCLFQAYLNVDYGPAYDADPDCTGSCCQSLQSSENYINQQGDGGLASDLRKTIDDVLGTPQASADPFYLLILGYPQFFNDQDTGDGSCDSYSFAPWWAKQKPNVVQSLRQKMNELVIAVNTVYDNTIDQWLQETSFNNQYVRFIDIDNWFNGHRFCEPGKTSNDQWYSPDVWFWNLQYWDKQDSNQQILMTNLIPDISQDADVDSIGQQIDQGLRTQSGSDGGTGHGWIDRTFHPKLVGHTAIKDSLIFHMRTSGMPGVIGDP